MKSTKEVNVEIDENGKRKPSSETIRSYDEQGYVTTEIRTDYSEGTKVKTQRFYDEDGNYLREEVREGDKSTKVTQIVTEPDKRLVRWLSTGQSGPPQPLKEMIYDNYRKEGSGREFDGRGRVTKSYRVVRNEKGQETETSFMDFKGKVTDHIIIVWDERGFITGETFEDKKKKETVITSTKHQSIDAAGNWTKALETSSFVVKGESLPLSSTEIVREIEYFQ